MTLEHKPLLLFKKRCPCTIRRGARNSKAVCGVRSKVPVSPRTGSMDAPLFSAGCASGQRGAATPRPLCLFAFLCSYGQSHRVLWQCAFILKICRGNVVPSRKESPWRSQRPQSVSDYEEERIAGDSWRTNKFNREKTPGHPGSGRWYEKRLPE